MLSILLLLLSLLSNTSSHVLDINPFSGAWLAALSSHPQAVFSLLVAPLLCSSILVWCSPTYLLLLLASGPKHYHQDRHQGAYWLGFLLGVLWFRVWHSLMHFELIFVPGVRRVLTRFICIQLCDPVACAHQAPRLQARTLEWLAMLSPGESSRLRDQTHVSHHLWPSFPSAIYRRGDPCPTVHSWLLCHKLTDHLSGVCF